MEQWDSSNFIDNLIDISDTLKPNLIKLDSNLKAVAFDKIVKYNMPNLEFPPCSVDAICTTDDTTYFIEFKPIKSIDCDYEKLKVKIKNKAIDSVLLINDFMKELIRNSRIFILVIQDPRYVFVESSTTRSSRTLSDEIELLSLLKRYHQEDSKKQPFVFSNIICLTCGKFVHFANTSLLQKN